MLGGLEQMNKIENINEYPIGGRSFDGKWTRIEPSTEIINAVSFSAGQSKTYDISSFIASSASNSDILCYFSIWVRTGTTSGNYSDVGIASSGFFIKPASIRTRTSNYMYCSGGAYLPFKAGDRTLTISNQQQASTITCHFESYKRLGTNT